MMLFSVRGCLEDNSRAAYFLSKVVKKWKLIVRGRFTPGKGMKREEAGVHSPMVLEGQPGPAWITTFLVTSAGP